MNKKLIRLIALACVLALLGTAAVFAAGDASGAFALVETSPAEGSTNTVAQNVAVKLIFNRDVSQESARAANAGIFKITTVQADEDGNESTGEIPYTALYNSDKYPKEVWLLCSEDLVQAQTYTVSVPGTMVSSDGETLGADQTFSFTIRNTKRDNTIYSILMIAFMALMMFFSVRDAAKKARGGDAKQQKKDVSVNPYKEAKKKGKTVAEVNAETAKKKAKIEEKEAKKAALKEQIRKEIEEERKKAREKSRKKHYRVMKAAPISKAGYKVSEAYLKSIHKK